MCSGSDDFYLGSVCFWWAGARSFFFHNLSSSGTASWPQGYAIANLIQHAQELKEGEKQKRSRNLGKEKHTMHVDAACQTNTFHETSRFIAILQSCFGTHLARKHDNCLRNDIHWSIEDHKIYLPTLKRKTQAFLAQELFKTSETPIGETECNSPPKVLQQASLLQNSCTVRALAW